jgi:hypothetical protein
MVCLKYERKTARIIGIGVIKISNHFMQFCYVILRLESHV